MLRDFFIFYWQNTVHHLDHGRVSAECVVEAGEFDPDGAGADHQQLLKSVSAQQQEQQIMAKSLANWKEKYEHIKVANAMLGSDQHKRDTKLKINALVRDIEQCIAQLSP